MKDSESRSKKGKGTTDAPMFVKAQYGLSYMITYMLENLYEVLFGLYII